MEPTSLDLFLRQQIYLEGLKEGEASNGDTMAEEMAALLLFLLNSTGHTSFKEMTKRELTKLLGTFNTRMTAKYKTFVSFSQSRLRAILLADYSVKRKMFDLLGGKSYSGPTGVKLWASIQNEIMPGVGLEPKRIIPTLLKSVIADVNRFVKIAFAEGLTIAELNARLAALLKSFRNKFASAFSTLIHYVSQYVSFKIGQTFFDYYQWISVLDGRTTDICISRSGRVYEYGNGPVPPAHYNCRSSIIPLVVTEVANNPGNPTLSGWLRTQPTGFQNDAMGKRRAQGFRGGNEDINPTEVIRPLTLDGYKNRVNRILTGQ